MDQVCLQLGGEGGICGVGGLDHFQMGGGFQNVQGGPSWPQAGGCGRPFDHGHHICTLDNEVVAGEVGDDHRQ